jgi:hypothetical protein
MRALILFFSLLAGITAVQAKEFDLYRLFGSPAPAIEVAGDCTLDREAISGSEKYCYYNCIDGNKTVTIGANEFCPLDMD